MAKMKTHHWTGATLSMKNLFGTVPSGVYGWPKNVLHWAGIEECIADLHAAFPRQFAIVDGIVGMEGNGPIQGVPKRVGVLVAGSDPVSVDATCCRIMGLDPMQIGYLHPDLHVFAVTHMIDRACVARCYSYANYEPSTAQFRIRAVAPNPFVAASYDDSWQIQNGSYMVKATDLPLLQVFLDDDGKLLIRSLKAGFQCGRTQLKALPALFRIG